MLQGPDRMVTVNEKPPPIPVERNACLYRVEQVLWRRGDIEVTWSRGYRDSVGTYVAQEIQRTSCPARTWLTETIETNETDLWGGLYRVDRSIPEPRTVGDDNTLGVPPHVLAIASTQVDR